MKIAFRVDASLSIGTGHVMRCLNLANALRDLGNECIFITKNHPGNYISIIKSFRFETFILKTLLPYSDSYLRDDREWLGGDQVDDALNSADLCALSNFIPDIVIVDHYSIDCVWEQLFKEKLLNIKIVVIDDLCNRDHLSDLLIDSTLGRIEDEYKNRVPEYCELLLGTKYALIKPDFSVLRKQAIEKRENNLITAPKVLITMGGVDMDNVTGLLLSIMDDVVSDDLECITVILGINNPHIEKIKSYSKIAKHKINVKINIDNMPEVMLKHDIAIGALGSTTWERATLGLPTINIAIAPNQLIIVNKLREHGMIVFDSPHFTPEDFIVTWESLKLHYSKFVQHSLELCDGDGLNRVVQRILKI